MSQVNSSYGIFIQAIFYVLSSGNVHTEIDCACSIVDCHVRYVSKYILRLFLECEIGSGYDNLHLHPIVDFFCDVVVHNHADAVRNLRAFSL